MQLSPVLNEIKSSKKSLTLNGIKGMLSYIPVSRGIMQFPLETGMWAEVCRTGSQSCGLMMSALLGIQFSSPWDLGQ